MDPDLVHAIFKQAWSRRALERERNQGNDDTDAEAVAGTSKKNSEFQRAQAEFGARPLVCLRAEAVQRAATIAEAEGVAKIEPTHFERILPQLLLDF